MSLKLDLHVHSKFHGEIYITAEKLREVLIKAQLQGIAITNFFDISHAVWLKKQLDDFIIIVGQEIWTKEGHIIGLGINKKISDFKRAEETISDIHDQGGIAIAPHPYLFLGIGKKVMSFPIDAIESYNGLMGASLIHNLLAMASARRRDIPQIASTDTTYPAFIGRSYTEVIVDDQRLILEAIRSGNVKLHKRAFPIPLVFILKNLLNFKNIEPCLFHAVPCFICGASMAVRIFKKRLKCFDCGTIQSSRILCSNGHYICLKCIIKREANSLVENYEDFAYLSAISPQ